MGNWLKITAGGISLSVPPALLSDLTTQAWNAITNAGTLVSKGYVDYKVANSGGTVDRLTSAGSGNLVVYSGNALSLQEGAQTNMTLSPVTSQ